MKLLLDTHIVLWALADNAKLPGKARLLIEDEGNDVFFSAASAWEVSIKHAAHPDRMRISGLDFMDYCFRAGFIELPVFGRHVEVLETLRRGEGAGSHNDPFDRIMISQAKVDKMLFLSHDSLIANYEEDCILPV